MAAMTGLLATKIHRPAVSLQRVQRTRLIRRLNDGLLAGRPLTLISAPPGFGKTTCAIEWINGLGMPVAWLSLDAGDNDPGRFFRYLAAALQKIDPQLGDEIQALAGEAAALSPGSPAVENISTGLINAILNRQDRFLLALDDFHLIHDSTILHIFEHLIAGLFQAVRVQPLHLMLITREDPALPVARLRASNQMTEIRAGDLRFTSAEAESFLNEMMGLGLTRMDVEALENRTEGWAAGLQLAGLSIQNQTDPSSFIARLSGSHRHILSYLTEEVLNRQPEEIQQFLLQTSILDRLTGDLCDAVTGRSDSRLLLEKLHNANLFLSALDDEQRWYRFHHLFADLLRSKHKEQQADTAARLHRSASGWYSRACDELPNGGERAAFVIEAIQHALAAADYESAVSLIERHATEMITQWYAKTVSGWMRALPPEWAARSPKANLAFAWMHLINRELVQAAPFIERLETLFSNMQSDQEAVKYPPVLVAEWLALQAILLNAQGKQKESLAAAEKALEMAPENASAVRSQIFMSMAAVYTQLDDPERAIDAYQMIIQNARETGNVVTEMLGVSGLALIALQRGELHFCLEIATQCLERAERAGPLPPVSTAVYGEIGQVYYHWNQIEQANHYFLLSIQGSALSGFSDAEIFHHVVLSRLGKMAGDLDEAAREIQKAADIMRIDAPAQVREEVAAQQVRIYLEQDRIPEAERALMDMGLCADGQFVMPEISPGIAFPYPRGLLLNSALRVLLHRAQVKNDREGLQKGAALAGRVIESALQRRFLTIAVEGLLLRSQMLAAAGDEAAALDDAGRAVDLGEPEGFISIFLEEGPRAARMLARLQGSAPTGSARARHIEKILKALSSTRPLEPAPDQAGLIEPLTERELEVLRLIAEGLKYEEIAARLFLSINTVRTYIKEIYGKLNVNNRAKAVALAQQHRLI